MQSFHDNAITLEPISSPDQSAGLFRMKELLVNAGWKVMMSGDGLSLYSATGDVITSPGDGAGGMDNPRAWYRLQSPGPIGVKTLPGGSVVDRFIEYTVQSIVVTSNFTVRIKNNKLGLNEHVFSGGTPDFQTTPEISSGNFLDEAVMNGSGDDASPVGGNWWQTSTASEPDIHTFGAAEISSPYRWWFTAQDERSPWAKGAGMVLDCVDPISASDDHPYVQIGATTRGGSSWSNASYNSFATTAAAIHSIIEGEYVRLVATRTAFPGAQVDRNQPDDAYVTFPVLYIRDDSQPTPRGVKGVSTMLQEMADTVGSQDIDRNTHLSSPGNTRDWIGGDDYITPWPSGTLFLHNVTPWSEEKIINVFAAVEPDPNPLTYRMTGIFSGSRVYWDAPEPDMAGAFFTDGAVTDVFVHKVIGR